MTATFWNGWQLWEKMCFILGCSIVVVICGGCVKLVYNHYRLRKYTRLAAEKAQIREQLQRTASVKHGSGKEIPFGIRALESGIEVDGVWISGSNTPAGSTPAHSAPGSPTLAATTEMHKIGPHDQLSSDRASLPSQMVHIEMPPQAYGHEGVRRPTPQPGSVRPTYQPRRSSGLRFSNSNEIYLGHLDDPSSALAALEGRTVGFGPAEEVADAHRRSKSWATTSWNGSHDPTSESSQALSNRPLLHPSHHPSIRLGGFPNYSAGLGPEYRGEDIALQDNRSASVVSAPKTIRAPMSYEDFPDEYVYEHALKTENDSSSSVHSDPFVTATKLHTNEYYVDSAPKFAELSRQTTENTETYSCNTQLENTAVQYPHETIEQPRRSQVIRKINSGFEILRPGTLDSSNHRSSVESARPRSAKEQDGKHEPKKLQRRRGDANLTKA